jgi:hypothetical protein
VVRAATCRQRGHPFLSVAADGRQVLGGVWVVQLGEQAVAGQARVAVVSQAKSESQSRPNVGIATVKTTGYNQEGKVVITFKRTIMVYKRGCAPHIPRLAPRDE